MLCGVFGDAAMVCAIIAHLMEKQTLERRAKANFGVNLGNSGGSHLAFKTLAMSVLFVAAAFAQNSAVGNWTACRRAKDDLYPHL